jgi:ATP-dependent DNA ligase
LLFEGVIPEGNYGAGTVSVWDTGTYTTESELSEQFEKGKIGFNLNGQKLRGRFYLVRTSTENQWLLLKKSDQFDSKEDLTISKPELVLTGKSNNQLATSKRKQSSSRSGTLYEAKNSKKTTGYRHTENSSIQKVSQLQDESISSYFGYLPVSIPSWYFFFIFLARSTNTSIIFCPSSGLPSISFSLVLFV